MLSLSAPQNIFLNGLNTKYRAYVGGFGSGKTFVGCLDLLIFASQNPKTVQGYFGTSYPSIRDIFYPTFTEAAEMMGFRVDIIESHKEVHLYRGRVYYGTIICRSMDNPASIVGFKIARALVDEIDTMPKSKAKQAWQKIIARLRLKVEGVINRVAVTTTPEGFGFVYDTFANKPTKSYSMVQASSYENAAFLPDDYIESMTESYSKELVEAYINGNFVNLTAGTIYSNFDRVLNNSNEVEDGAEPLFIGMDFNVNNMSAIVHVKRKGQPVAVDEILGVADTPAMIEILKSRYEGRQISIFPDASGNSRKTVNASETDISMLQSAGFDVYNNAANPRVKDRINSMQSAFLNAKGERFYKVNVEKCPNYAANLEQQSYNQAGEPDKSGGNDHTNDAAGYFISYDYAIIKPLTKLNVRF